MLLNLGLVVDLLFLTLSSFGGRKIWCVVEVLELRTWYSVVSAIAAATETVPILRSSENGGGERVRWLGVSDEGVGDGCGSVDINEVESRSVVDGRTFV
jgi:hypothetical protein